MLYINAPLQFLLKPNAPNTQTYFAKDVYAPHGINEGTPVMVLDEEAEIKATGRIIEVLDGGESFQVVLNQSTLRSTRTVDKQLPKAESPVLNILLSLIFSLSVIGYFMWSGLEVLFFTLNYEPSFDSWQETLATSIPWLIIAGPALAGVSARHIFKTRRAPRQAWVSTFLAGVSGAIGGLTFLMLAIALLGDPTGATQSLTPEGTQMGLEEVSRVIVSVITVTMMIGAAIPTYLALSKVPTTEYIRNYT